MIVYAIAVLGLILLTGFNGQISLGHGAFFAVGAYVAAILIDQANWPYWATLPLAAAICFVVGYLFGLPALRLEGHYLALATFALAVAVPQILKYRHFEWFTNGVQGINIFKPDPPFGVPLSADQWMYLVVLAVAVVMFWIARNLLDSRTGRALRAIRDHTMAAGTMGINVAHYKTVVFGISALYTGVAGALHAIIFEFVAPDSFRFELSIAILVGAVVGGIASLAGRRDRRRVRAGDRKVRRCTHQKAHRRGEPAARPRTMDHLRNCPDRAHVHDADGNRWRIGAAVAAAERIVTARARPPRCSNVVTSKGGRRR